MAGPGARAAEGGEGPGARRLSATTSNWAAAAAVQGPEDSAVRARPTASLQTRGVPWS